MVVTPLHPFIQSFQWCHSSSRACERMSAPIHHSLIHFFDSRSPTIQYLPIHHQIKVIQSSWADIASLIRQYFRQVHTLWQVQVSLSAAPAWTVSHRCKVARLRPTPASCSPLPASMACSPRLHIAVPSQRSVVLLTLSVQEADL
jgi:hypothetical protein